MNKVYLCTQDNGTTYTYIYGKNDEELWLSIYPVKGKIRPYIVNFIMKGLIKLLHRLGVFTSTRLSSCSSLLP